VGTTAIALRDLGGSLLRLPLAARLALDDIEGKYRRTLLGPLWIATAQAVTIGGFVLVFSGLFGVPADQYAIYLAAGFPVWAMIASFLTEMPATFILARGVIESYELPWLTHIWRRSIAYLLTFAHQIVTLAAVMAIMKVTPSINMLFAIPALFLLLIAGTGVGLLLAVLGARYRDLQPALQIVAGFLFLFTPIIWQAERLRQNEWVVDYNPVHYMVELVRGPLMGQAPDPTIFMWTAIASFGLFILGFLAFSLGRRRLYHWL
jgi:ABC-type polysaccharide/polyol phosphate export permease